MFPYKKTGSLLAIALAWLTCAPWPQSSAADIYWDGTNGSWASAGNWVDFNGNPAGIPGISDYAIFDFYSSGAAALTTLGGAQSVGGLVFEDFESPFTLGLLPASEELIITGLNNRGILLDPTSNGNSRDVTINFDLYAATTRAQSWTNLSDDHTITYNGRIKLGNTLTFNGNGDHIVNGVIEADGTTNARSIEKNGSGTLIINNTINNAGSEGATGNLRILDGTVEVNMSTISAIQLIFGTSSSGIQGADSNGILNLGNTSAVDFRLGGTLYVHRTSDGGVIKSEGTGSATSFLSLNGSRTFMIGDTMADVDLRVQVGIVDGSATGGLIKRSIGTLVLEGVNTYTGSTSVDRGKLILNYEANNGNNKLSDSAVLTMRGGWLELQGNSTAATSETVGSLTINGGSSTIKMTSNGHNVSLNIAGNITRNAVSGVINFVSDDPAISHITIGGSTANNAGGFLGGWATINGSRWAARSGDEIVALAGTTNSDKSQWTAADNVIINGSPTGTLITPEIRSLILDDVTGGTFTIDNRASVLTLAQSALLLTKNVTADTVITGGQLMTKNSTNDAVNELIITNHSATSKLIIEASLGTSNTFLTATQHVFLGGSGIIELSGASSALPGSNTYVHGNVIVSSHNALSTYGALSMAPGGDMTEVGARIQITGTVMSGRITGGGDAVDTYFDRGPGEIALGTSGRLVTHQTADSTYSGAFTGELGSVITKKGNGVLSMQTNASNFKGEVRVEGGGITLTGSGNGLLGLHQLTVRGGTVTSNQNQGSVTDKLGDSADVQLEGTIGNGLAVLSNQNGNRNEAVGTLTLAGGSNTITINNSAATTGATVVTSLTFGKADSFSRTNGATLLVRGRNLGLAPSANNPSSRVIFTNPSDINGELVGTSSTADATNLKILPYAIGENNSTSALNLVAVGNSFLTYGAGGTGLRVLTDNEYTNAFTAGHNVSFNATPNALVGTNINSLRLVTSSAGITVTGSGNLVLDSGALLMAAGATDNDATITGFNQITSGAAVDEIIAFVTSSNASAVNAILTINSNIVDNGQAVALTKSGAGTLVLGGTNSYTGATTINEGILRFFSATNLGGGMLRLAGGTLHWADTNSTDITAGGRTVELLGSSVYFTPNAGGNILNAGNVFDIGANTVTLSNAIGNGGYGGLTKRGTGTLTLSAAPTYTGATWIAEGAMNFATIAPDTTEALYLVSTTGGSVSSNIANGLNVQTLIVGGAYTNPGSNQTGVTGTLTVNAGAVNIGKGEGDDFILIGYRDSTAGVSTSVTRGTVDFRNASSVNIDVQSIHIGYLNGGTPNPNTTTTSGILQLSQNGTNLIKAGSIILGHSPIGVVNSGNSTSINSEITLGSGSNTIHTDTFVVGGAKSNGKVTIASGGSFTLRGWLGGETGANLFIGDNDETNTNVANFSFFDLTGASDVDMIVNLLVLGRIGEPNNSTGRGDGTLTFGTGQISATTIRMADYAYHVNGVASASTANPSLTKGTINQSGDAVMKFMHLSKGTGQAAWNWNSGTIQNLEGADQTNENVVISLNGSGTATDPSLRRYTVDAGQTSTFQAAASFAGSGSFTKSGGGTLGLLGNNTNTGNHLISDGSVALRGAGAMNDVAWINLAANGIFDVTQRTGGTYTSDAVISGTGTIKATNFTVGSNVGTTNTNGVLRPGSSSTNNSAANAATVGNQTGTLNVQGDLTLAGSTSRVDRLVLQLSSTTYNASSTLMNYGGDLNLWAQNIPTDHAAFLNGTGGGNYDHIQVEGQLYVNHHGGITVTGDSYVATAGDVFNLIDWVGVNLDSQFTVGPNYRNGTETGFDLILPNISLSGLQWDTSLFLEHGIIVVTAVVPEPGRALLLFTGLLMLAQRRGRPRP